jgi:5-methylcytosine-specific restriction endonuclease McrA
MELTPLELTPQPWANRTRPGRRAFRPSIAKRILRQSHECALQLPGCTITPTEVDHIVGWSDALALGWDPADIDDPTNGQAVCRTCHATKTRAQQQRGRQRQAERRAVSSRRQAEPHPGLKRGA